MVSEKPAASWAARLPVSPLVLWTGLAAGAFLAVEAAVHDVVVPLGLGVFADAIVTFLFIIALAVVVAELTRRHHRTVGGHAARQVRRAVGYGRRQSAAGARLAGRRGRTVLAWLAAKAGRRWENMRAYNAARRERDRQIDRDADEAAQRGAGQPADLAGTEGHNAPRQDAAEEDSPAGAAPSPPTTEGNTTMAPSKIAPGHRAQRAARTGAATVPSEWAAVVASAADFEPENDGELLGWMARQVTGLSGWAEALVDFYEHCTAVIGIDPAASAMLHDVADAAAQAAETMGAAKAKFAEHYELPREFAANGGLMTHDGRWVTGEGA
jgi:hypothetical protein